MDATDIKAALLESMEGEWNGDQNLLLGVLDALEEEYQSRCHAADQGNVPTIKHDLEQDVTWLLEFLGKLSKAYEKKLKTRNTPQGIMMRLSWSIVETSNLIKVAREFIAKYAKDGNLSQIHNGLKEDLREYLKGLFNKKREPAATHVLVIMVSDEERKSKPYAMPVQYVPYHSLKDADIVRLTKDLKKKMTDMGMNVVGMCTFTIKKGNLNTLSSLYLEKFLRHVFNYTIAMDGCNIAHTHLKTFPATINPYN